MFATVAAAVSAYLTVVHYAGGALVCTVTAVIDCDAVTRSSYSLVPGTDVPVSAAGLVWSIVAAAGALLAMRADPPWLRPAYALWAAAGALVSLYLIDAELTVIHRICEWCTVVHLLTFAALFVALARLRGAEPT